jgi:hypothetical protein
MAKKNNYTIALDADMLERLRKIAFNLDYVWGKKGSITLLLIGICKGDINLTKENVEYKLVKKESK